jgi:antitoxin component of MazEF toxin-antitoxin module
MPRNVVEDENVRSLTLMGDGRSLGLTIPIRLVRKLNLKPQQQVRVVRRGENLVIKTDG